MKSANAAEGAAPRKERRGYDKGEETRRAILDSALALFGESGYAAVTTRQIASASGVNLPALSYYFGGKEGLYIACAETVIEHWLRHTKPTGERAAAALSEGLSPEQARALLKQVFADVQALLGDSLASQSKLAFLAREMNEPGPAYELLYTELWSPGSELVAALVAAAKGLKETGAAERLDAALLLSSISTVTQGASVTKRLMGWRRIGPEELDALFAAVDRRIDALG